MAVRILVSGAFAALTVAVAQEATTVSGGRIDTTGAGDIPTVVIMAVAFILASAAQWLVSSVQIEKMARNRRLNRALLSGIVTLGLALYTIDAGMTWSKLLGLSVGIGLLGPSAVDILLKKFGMEKPTPPPNDDEDKGGQQ